MKGGLFIDRKCGEKQKLKSMVNPLINRSGVMHDVEITDFL